jgi:hypothetical protein
MSAAGVHHAEQVIVATVAVVRILRSSALIRRHEYSEHATTAREKCAAVVSRPTIPGFGRPSKIPAPKTRNWLSTCGSWKGFVETVDRSTGQRLEEGVLTFSNAGLWAKITKS